MADQPGQAAGGQVPAPQSMLIGRLSPDRELARQAAFALFVQAYLEQVGFVRRRFTSQKRSTASESKGSTEVAPLLEELPEAVAEVRQHNPHILRYFEHPARVAALSTLDASAGQELLGWLQAQQLEAEEPQMAYELAALALGVELPAILVRGLRQAQVLPESQVIELPDGSGYPTIFLSTLQPHWPAAQRARLFVQSTDAEQLAAWAMLLLAQRLVPPSGSIVRVTQQQGLPFQESECDFALVYNPVSWLAAPEQYEKAARAAKAGQVLLL